jgi:hypothetical protein
MEHFVVSPSPVFGSPLKTGQREEELPTVMTKINIVDFPLGATGAMN